MAHESSTEEDALQLGIIGIGNLGYALSLGLSQSPQAAAWSVLACDRNDPKRQRLEQETGFPTTADWREVVRHARVLVLAVRTEQVLELLREATPLLRPHHVVICLAAGISLQDLQKQIAMGQVVRAIPNVNMAAGRGFTFILVAPDSSADDAVRLFSAVGRVVCTESEADFNRHSVLTGCAPALMALVLEAMGTVGSKIDIRSEDAQSWAMNALLDTAASLSQLNVPPEEYKWRVAAPGGIMARLLEDDPSARLRAVTESWFGYILDHLTRDDQNAEQP